MSSQFHKNSIPNKKFEWASEKAEVHTANRMPELLDKLENALLVDGEIKYNRGIADRIIGESVAFAYSSGALDKSLNKDVSVSKLILT
jgi:hypothetical protein